METRIQYVKTEDGVDIAYAAYGEGRPFILMGPWPFCHLEAELSISTLRHYEEQLATHTRLIRYDGRGSGLSQRDVEDLSLKARVLDLKAVVDSLEFETFDISAYGTSGPVAILYTANHADRVDHLILWESYANTADYFESPELQGLLGLANSDWDTFTEAMASAFFGWSAAEPAREMAAVLRECVTQEQGRTSMAAAFASGIDVSDQLSHMKTPTLVVYCKEATLPGVDAARSLASAIPKATLVALDGTWITTDELAEAAANALFEFLGIGSQPSVGGSHTKGETHTILFTDMEASTTLTQQLGDAAAQEVRRTHNDIVRSGLSANNGNEIKHTGDGIMASFATASSALDAAIAIQRGVAEHREKRPDSPLGVYIGLNAGEPIAEDDDLFGTSIDLAARICDHAGPGQILASNVVRELAAGKDFLFSDLGETELRGFEDPIKLWELRWQGD